MRPSSLFIAAFFISACVGGSTNAGGTAVPAGLVATAGNGRVSLTWTAVSGAQSYEVSRSVINGAAATVIGTPTGPAFVDTQVKNGLFFDYSVRAVGEASKSADSAAVSAAPFRAICVAQGNVSQIAVFNGENHINDPRSFGGRTHLGAQAIALDPTHGEVFAANGADGPADVTVYPASGNGNISPTRTLQPTEFFWTAKYDPTDDRLMLVTETGISTFDRTASGSATPVRKLVIIDGIAFGIGNAVLTGPAHGDRLFVMDLQNNKIYVYGRTDSSTAPLPPAATITAPIVFNHAAVAFDPVTDELLVGDVVGTVVAFPASSSGVATATRTLRGAQTGLAGVSALAVDADRGLLYVADVDGKISTFPSNFGTTANIAPSAVLAGPSTRLGTAVDSLAVDPSSGKVFAQSSSSILVFPSSPAGDVAPPSDISSTSTGLERPNGLAFDSVHAELLVANEGSLPEITAYDDSASGFDVTPLRRLSTPAGNVFIRMGVAYVPSRDEVAVGPQGLAQIPIYARTASGDAAPLRTIAGPNTLLQEVSSIALDAAHDAVVVNDFGTLRRFALSFSDGNEAPLTSISGPNTGLGVDIVFGISVDNQNGEIFVATAGGVSVFRLTDDGDVAPIRILTLPGGAADLVVDPVADEMFVLDSAQLIQVFARTATGTAAPLRGVANFGDVQGFASGIAICN